MNFSTWEWASFGWTSKQCHRQTWEKHRSNELSEFHSEKKISKVFFLSFKFLSSRAKAFILKSLKPFRYYYFINTHTLALSLSRSLSLSHSLFYALFTHTYMHWHTYSIFLSLSLIQTHTHTQFISLTLLYTSLYFLHKLIIHTS